MTRECPQAARSKARREQPASDDKSDSYCGRAYAAQITRDELPRQFGEQSRIGWHRLRVFGAVSARIDAGRGDRAGAAERERFPAKRVVTETEPGLDATAGARSPRQEAE